MPMVQNNKGFFISFEGADGTGKTTQIRILSQRLTDQDYKVHVTREPGGSELAENIRTILKSAKNIDSISEVLLMFAARRSHFVETIQPLLQQGYIVISDRFYDSSLVYQGLLKNVPINQIMVLKRLAIGDFEPDLTLILDIDAETAMSRAESRKTSQDDTYDSMSLESFEKVRQGFLRLVQIFEDRTHIVNASGTVLGISQKIYKIVQKSLNFENY
ncbi:MAG: dTMP kinase [Alphaproteobacteria bacterium]|nr:dTMP kinase [Alphaproteobacteria bacterium]